MYDWCEVTKVVRLRETEKRKVFARKRGKEEGKLMTNRYKVPVLQDEKLLESCCITV